MPRYLTLLFTSIFTAFGVLGWHAPAVADKPVAPKPDAYTIAQSAFDKGNYSEARKLWLPLAEHGDVRSQYAVGRLYEKGRGVGRDFEQAARWYRKAAEQGHADSQYRLAVGYAYGLGVEKDEVQALHWLRQAANGGQRRAQKALGRAYQDGLLGLRADSKLAKYWYDKAESDAKHQ